MTASDEGMAGRQQIDDETATCPLCGAPARLRCTGCNRAFCVDHLERRFVMGYVYCCATCLAKQEASPGKAAKRRKKSD
jgi:hypothetical protein